MIRRADEGLGHLLIGQPELAELLMRGMALKGALPQYCGAEIGPSATVADLTQPEFMYLRRTTRLWQSITLPAVAAQFSQCAFSPVTGAARTLAVVEAVILTCQGTTTGFQVDCIPSALIATPAGVPKSSLDDRAIPFNQLQPTPSFGIVNATAAAGLLTGTGAPLFNLTANTSLFIPLNAVFTARQVLTTPAPSFLIVQCTVVNVPIVVNFIWRERPLLATEAL